jgi:hypothetical protein
MLLFVGEAGGNADDKLAQKKPFMENVIVLLFFYLSVIFNTTSYTSDILLLLPT